MRVKRGSNIDSLLARKLEDDGSRLSDFGEQGREASVDGRRIREYFVARGKPDDYQYSPSEAREAINYFKGIDRGNPFIPEEMDIEGLENRAIDEASERQSRIDNISASGPDIYKQRYNTENEGESRYLNKLARESYKPEVAVTPWGAVGKGGIKEDTEGESALDKIGRENMLNDMDDLGPDKTDVESSFWERTKQGRVGDAFSGLFSSDSGRDESLAQEKKDNEALGGKIAAAGKLYSMFKPEQQQAAPQIPTASITRGSVAFPGMQLASQKARRKYFTPKGLMA